MVHQSLNAFFKQRIGDLTADKKKGITHVVKECAERYESLRVIQRGWEPKAAQDSQEEWARAKRWVQPKGDFLDSLDNLDRLIPRDLSEVVRAVLNEGPNFRCLPRLPSEASAELRSRHDNAIKSYRREFDELAAKVGSFFESLLDFLRRTPTKGDPGRKQEYPKSIAWHERQKASKSNKLTDKQLYQQARAQFPDEFHDNKLADPEAAYMAALRRHRRKERKKKIP